MSEKFEIMEQRDEDQILAEAKGHIIKEMFYKFPIDGKEVVGMSWVGTKEIARRYGGIKMGIPVVTDLGDQYACSVQATDTKNDVTLVGSSLQPKMMKKRDGSEVPDRFAYTKVTSKAQRNAIRALIPETFLLAMEKSFSKGESFNPPKTRHEIEAEVVEEQEHGYVPFDGDYDIENIKQHLTKCGFDGEKFKLHHDEPTRMVVVDSFPRLSEDEFKRYRDVVIPEMGGEYDRDHKKTVFKY